MRVYNLIVLIAADFLISTCSFRERYRFFSSLNQIQHKILSSANGETDMTPLPEIVVKPFLFATIKSIMVSSFIISKSMKPSPVNAKMDPIPVRPLAYSVEYTNPPSLQPRTTQGEESLLNKLATEPSIVLLGSHIKDDGKDRLLEVSLLDRLIKKRSSKNREDIKIAMEIFPDTAACREALKDYIQSKGSVDEEDAKLFKALQNQVGFNISFIQNYMPLLHFAREKGIRLLPLQVPDSVINKLEKYGLEGLNDSERNEYIPDAQGFLNSVKSPGFKRYADEVILSALRPVTYSDELNQVNKSSQGIFSENYFSARIFGDEAMASKLVQTIDNEKTLCIALLRPNSIIFGYGIVDRIKRMLYNQSLIGKSSSNTNDVRDYYAVSNLNAIEEQGPKKIKKGITEKNVESKLNEMENNALKEANLKVKSILLNPTAQDSLSYTKQLRLSISYGDYLSEQRPLVDYLWFSYYPPINLLTRMKNPISKEGDKPPGESSILKAF